jgi:hypothetical protein
MTKKKVPSQPDVTLTPYERAWKWYGFESEKEFEASDESAIVLANGFAPATDRPQVFRKTGDAFGRIGAFHGADIVWRTIRPPPRQDVLSVHPVFYFASSRIPVQNIPFYVALHPVPFNVLPRGLELHDILNRPKAELIELGFPLLPEGFQPGDAIPEHVPVRQFSSASHPNPRL